MKKIAYLLLVVTLFCVTGCKKKDLKSQIVGTWEATQADEKGSITFSEDGKFTATVIQEGQTFEEGGTYTIDAEAKAITLDFTKDGVENQTISDIKIDGDKMTANNESGEVTMQKKK